MSPFFDRTSHAGALVAFAACSPRGTASMRRARQSVPQVTNTVLLEWVGRSLALRLRRLNDAFASHIFCQLYDMCYPGMWPSRDTTRCTRQYSIRYSSLGCEYRRCDPSALWLRAQRRQSPHAQGSVACTLRGRAPGELPRLAVCICTIGRDKGAPRLRLQPRGVERPGTLTAWLLVFGLLCQRIDMAVLAKNKFQENLQFLHWLHNQWVAAGSKVDDYDPVRRRSSCKGEEDTCPVHAA